MYWSLALNSCLFKTTTRAPPLFQTRKDADSDIILIIILLKQYKIEGLQKL